jgi:hypothetical protein
MSSRAVWIALAICALCSGVAIAQEQGVDAIRKLAFLAGSWHCVVQGAKVPSGDAERLSYEFAPDWSWMVERSNLRENGQEHWAVQLWGYDAQRKKLVAYQFNSGGVFTKSVDGWIGGRFQSKRDDSGATVSLVPISKSAFDWVIEAADNSYTVKEACTR